MPRGSKICVHNRRGVSKPILRFLNCHNFPPRKDLQKYFNLGEKSEWKIFSPGNFYHSEKEESY